MKLLRLSVKAAWERCGRRDPRLDRIVALKVSDAQFSDTAVLRFVNFFTGFNSVNGAMPAKLLQYLDQARSRPFYRELR